MPSRSSFKTKEEYNAYFREYRKNHLEKHRAYQREYNHLYRKRVGYGAEEKWQKNNPIKVRAEHILQYAVRKGEIKRLPCRLCGNEKSIAHHADYGKPLTVVFLCHAHHRQYHYGSKEDVSHNNTATGLDKVID